MESRKELNHMDNINQETTERPVFLRPKDPELHNKITRQFLIRYNLKINVEPLDNGV